MAKTLFDARLWGVPSSSMKGWLTASPSEILTIYCIIWTWSLNPDRWRQSVRILRVSIMM